MIKSSYQISISYQQNTIILKWFFWEGLVGFTTPLRSFTDNGKLDKEIFWYFVDFWILDDIMLTWKMTLSYWIGLMDRKTVYWIMALSIILLDEMIVVWLIFESGLPFLNYDLTSNFYNHKIGPPIWKHKLAYLKLFLVA